jgi:hypothetical protein
MSQSRSPSAVWRVVQGEGGRSIYEARGVIAI